MNLNSYERVKELTQNMVAIPSINKEPGGESAVARYVRDFYLSLPYFRKYPNQVNYFQTKEDFVERHSTMAYVKGTKGTSNRTVILIGHIDTVGVDDFGTIREYAFRCEELPEKLRESFVLSQEVIDDIESGEYMFGRGVLDMKSGVAGHMYLIQYFSEHPEELNGNLLAIAECDEEDNSKGIITALDILAELKRTEGFEYVACVNADYSTNYAPGDENRYVYYGSIGKLLPCFAVFGKEAHVGQAFSAFDPNLLLANITRKISLNTELCDIAHGEVTIPPISLKQMDTKVSYTVQTALTALGYYNFFTHGWDPSVVLDKSRSIAVKAFDETIDYLNDQYRRFCELSKVDFCQLPWETKVYTWSEFYNMLAAEHGEAFTTAIRDFTVRLHREDPTLDLRLFGLRVIQEAWEWSEDKSPAVIVYFGSIFSARIEMTGRTEKEKALLDAVEAAIEKIRPEADRQIKTRMFYPYISDSSFMAVCDDTLAIQEMIANMPQYGVKYSHPVEKIQQIDVPVVNIGTFGHDGHMLTERVDMRHTFQNVPNITYEVVTRLLE
ncbi:MAG: M20/M25/M40 family metallo-hydrolase [Hornefia butyriciproducens]|uniref:M20/M25/M40 family metallo-hydrolase n=1 Tax=Hornefia butyriciproducens TaxID=2652293 RepID=UPI002A7548A4|nr:M20/M25/M40 family metallo-hydrolase [Hornefia butyriciproducens]MCI7326040.1 M20/M25/M40 family metallo-hydrolase [Clostridiales bacterium]MDY2991905.1 M20/M25/M40 family metallo-hydrolase [Hornefia butyriciproducens]